MFIPDGAAVGNSGVIFCKRFEIHSGNLFIVFVQIINNMQHIIKQVKAVTKKYTTKSGEKESTSKRVDLGVTDIFDVDEYVAVISETNFNEIDKTIADKDATISNLNDSVAKHKAEVTAKTNKIGDLSKEIKALKTKVAELESDVSAKDDIIGELESGVDGDAATIGDLEKAVADKDATIDDLNAKVNKLSATVDELKPLLLTKDSTITDLEKQIAVYDATDISDLKEKSKKLEKTADELDKSKNVIIRLQNEKMDLQQLVNYHKETATAYKNQNAFSKLIGRDAATDVTLPTLTFIDISGNPIAKNDDAATDDSADSGKDATPDDN